MKTFFFVKNSSTNKYFSKEKSKIFTISFVFLANVDSSSSYFLFFIYYENMSTADIIKTQYVTCGKEKVAYQCDSCSLRFSFYHLAEHRQQLQKQFDQIEYQTNLLRQKYFPNKFEIH